MRKLAIIASSFSAAVFAANYLLPDSALIIIALALAILGAVLCLFAKKRPVRMAAAMLISAALGLALFSVHSSRTGAPAKALDGQTLALGATVLDYPVIYDDYCRVEVRFDGAASRLKAVLYADKHALDEITPGNTIQLTTRLHSADMRYGKEYDYYNSKGIYLTATAKSDIICTGCSFTPTVLASRIRHGIAGYVDELFPKDTRAFMRSVMLGDKGALYDDIQVYTDLTRAGFMHVAAVSGMHISFLVALLQFFLGKSRRGSIVCIALIWCFVLVTGANPSAVRAGFMQSALLVAPIVRRENDPVTSLSTVLALVLLVNPHAAASVSLQLSFGAMVGIYGFFDRINAALIAPVRNRRARRWLRNPISIAACSLSVMVVTVPLTAAHFGYVSVLSPLMNIAALWAVSLCFCGGFVVCALGAVWSVLGMAGAWCVSWAARYIFLAARLVSAVPFAVAYLDSNVMLIWLILCYAFFVGAAFTHLNAIKRLIYPLVLCAVTYAAALGVMTVDYSRGCGTLSVLDVGQGQSICVLSGRACVLVDCGGGAKTQRAGETAGAYLFMRGHTRVDALVLTHLHADHANGVQQLMELVDVGMILIPNEPNDDDALLSKLLDTAATHGTQVVYVARDMLLEADGISVALYAPGDEGDTNERCVMSRVSLGSFDMLITGDAPIKAENELVAEHDIADVEVYVVGHHGSKYSSGDALLESIGADTAIISVGYNTYGHPTNETLERLDEYGYNVYRTDQDGRVEISVR